MKKQYVRDLKAGDAVDDIFVLSEKHLAQKKDGNHYLNVILADKTGTIKGVVWDNLDQAAGDAAAGNVVRVRASVSDYRGSSQMVVKTMTPCPVAEFDPADFLPATSRNVDAMFERLVSITNAMETGYLKSLFGAFWEDAEFVGKFKTAPAAKKMHHAYLGGLLEHTLSMVILVDRIAGHYSGVDRDLLLSGAILHDIGKIREFEYTLGIDYTDEGRLLSHIVIGIQMLEEKLKRVTDFPQEKAVLLKHLIVSHHGTREFGSPELPKTIEAILLNYIDEIDSKINGIREFISSEDPSEAWTSYHRLLGRHFYTGKKTEDRPE